MTTASKAKWALILLLAVFLLIVAFQNLEVVEVRVLLWPFELTIAVLLAITTLIGFLMGFFARTLWHVRSRHNRGKPA